MQENNSTNQDKSPNVEHSATKTEKAAKKTRKQASKTTVKKQPILPQGKTRNILVAAAVLCLGLIALILFLLTSNTTPPIINKVSVSDIADTKAVITWQTSKPATTQVEIWDSNASTSTELDETLVTKHSVPLNDLKLNTRYRFTLISKDRSGSKAELEIELTTPPQPYVPQLVISELKISNVTDFSATITWQTDRPATSQIEYGETNSYGLTAPASKEPAIKHSCTLIGLKPKTAYHFIVKSKDTFGKEAATEDKTVITLSTSAAAIEVGTEIGKRAPDFTLTTLDGKELSLNQFQGKKVMVNFWKSSCSACADEMPDIQSIYNQWPRENLEILAVNMGERKAFVQSFVDSNSLTFPILLDVDEAVSGIYQITETPSTIFINDEGVITEIKKGSFTGEPEIERMLNSLQ